MAELVCNACQMPPYPPDLALDAVTSLPMGWVVRRINGRSYTLCDCCGSIRHFKGGVSTYLQEHLGVAADARCDFDEVPGGGFHRSRFRR